MTRRTYTIHAPSTNWHLTRRALRRQDGERHGHDDAEDDRHAADPRVRRPKRAARLLTELEAIVVRQGRHYLAKAVAVGGNARRLGEKDRKMPDHG